MITPNTKLKIRYGFLIAPACLHIAMHSRKAGGQIRQHKYTAAILQPMGCVFWGSNGCVPSVP